jgi:hypothetical protein
MGQIRRVVVVGDGGAGKSQLSKTLAHRLGLPLVHLDPHYWRPGWAQPSTDEWRAQVDALVRDDEWVLTATTAGARTVHAGRAAALAAPGAAVRRRTLPRRYWLASGESHLVRYGSSLDAERFVKETV